MTRSAARIRSLKRACELVHDRAFNSRQYHILPTEPLVRPVTPTASPAKSRKEWLEERFHEAVQREFTRLGID
jgi:hypothetical protein